MNGEFLLSADEVAARLKVNRATIYRHVSAGRMPAPLKLGRRTLWRAAELRAWVEAGMPPASRWSWPRQEVQS